MKTVKMNFTANYIKSAAITITLLTGLATAIALQAKAQGVAAAEPPSSGNLANLPRPAQSAISAALGRGERGYSATKALDGFHLENAEQQLEAEVSSRGVEVNLAQQNWTVRLQGYGRGTDLITVDPATPKAEKNRVEYDRGAMTEWYINGPLGLEQGFTLNARPGQARNLPLTIVLAVSGNLTANIDADKAGLTLVDHFGDPAMRYTGLRAYDASGKALHALLQVQGQQLILEVDDAGAAYPVIVDPFIEKTKLVSSTGMEGDKFGYSVAIDTDGTVVVGAPSAGGSGAAYIFEKPDKGWGDLTTETCKLTTGANAADRFGFAVSIKSSVVVVGAPYATGSGRAYVFVRPDKGWPQAGLNTPDAILVPVAGAAPYRFGWSVSYYGGAAAVGAPGRSTGAVYIFYTPSDGWKQKGANVTKSAVLTPKDKSGSWLGFSVAQATDKDSNRLVLAGQPHYNCIAAWIGKGAPPKNDCGRVLVFVQKSGNNWKGAVTETARLEPDGACSDGCQFGRAVDIISGTAVVGAPYATVKNVSTGRAYVFVTPTGLWNGGPYKPASVFASDGQKGDNFGWSVSLGFNTLLVGAPAIDNGNPGKAYLFDTAQQPWKETKPPFTAGGTADRFGFSVFAPPTNVAPMTIGASQARGGKDDLQPYAGAAYLYLPEQKAGGSRVKLDPTTWPDSGAANVSYVSVAASGVPDGSINTANVLVELAGECHGTPSATTSAISIVSGSGDSTLLSFLLPGGLAPGQYFIRVSDSEEGDANFESSNCSAVNVAR